MIDDRNGVARPLRVEFEGGVYHLMSRGDRREAIFRDDADRNGFVELLAEACLKTGWQVHAYCLMGNHFHMVVETPQPNLVAGMKWLLGTYTGRFNRRHRLTGHLFGGRYKALIVDAATPGYLSTVCEYVHLNPVRAGLLKAQAPLKDTQERSPHGRDPGEVRLQATIPFQSLRQGGSDDPR